MFERFDVFCVFFGNMEYFVIYLGRKIRFGKYKEGGKEGKYEFKFFLGEFKNGGDE